MNQKMSVKRGSNNDKAQPFLEYFEGNLNQEIMENAGGWLFERFMFIALTRALQTIHLDELLLNSSDY